MSDIYPPGPAEVPDGLTRPSTKYKLRAWLTMLGLIVFVTLYLALTGWFGWTAFRLLKSALFQGDTPWKAVGVGLASAFLAVFMVKALFSVKRGQGSGNIELKPDAAPELFDFLNRLADDAGAPRPHKAYVSPRVNASVFYDLSILNFIFPSRKNLEIGLGLVNVLNLGELKAVLAHEFGHFAQKSMAVGNWVYVAHQIAAHIINQRGILDEFIHGISRIDFRIAWIGWILRLIVWSIRSLIDSVFSLVMMAERALSRQMEFQADLVAVSLTGSDALIHALHKLNAADEAWNRTLKFLLSEAMEGRAVRDPFAIHRRFINKLGIIFNDPGYGKVPPVPEVNAENHRIFKAALASPPKMWATHPENSAREENAKRTYVAADIEERSAWSIFRDQAKIRSDISKLLFVNPLNLKTVELEESFKNLDKKFNKIFFHKKFRGIYLGRSITRHVENAADLYGDEIALKDIDSELDALYPEFLAADMERLKNLYEKKEMLKGIQQKQLQAIGDVIRHKDKIIKQRELPHVIKTIESEIKQVEIRLQKHDARCRAVHSAIARHFGKGWQTLHSQLLALLHYADHSEANLRDVRGYLGNVVAVITADDRVTKSELRRLLDAANEARRVLFEIYHDADQIELGKLIEKALEIDSWSASLRKFELPYATEQNINEWMKVIDNWISRTLSPLSALKASSLEQLLKVEGFLSKYHRSRTEPPFAPKPPKVPDRYSTLVQGNERDRQTKLGLWDSFYTADGFFPAVLRSAVAVSIVGGVILFSYFTGASTVTIYNGLGNTVEVSISGLSARIPSYHTHEMKLLPGNHQHVSAIVNRQTVETFDAPTTTFANYVYNIAGAAPMIEKTQVYGKAIKLPDHLLGAPRWFSTSAHVLFKNPPQIVRTKGKGATRLVLGAVNNLPFQDLKKIVKKDNERLSMIRNHVAWDRPDSDFIFYWIKMAAETNDLTSILEERLNHYQNDVAAMRMMQDYTSKETGSESVCERHRTLAEQNPDNSDFQFLSVRCIDNEKQKQLAYLEGVKKWPENAWFQCASGYVYAEQGQWADADRAMTSAIKQNNAFREVLAADIKRLKQVQGIKSFQIETSQELRIKFLLESGLGLNDSPYRFYSLINKGNLRAAEKSLNLMTKDRARCIRLLAASDGASREMIDEALKLNIEEGLDPSTVLLCWSQAVREGKNPLACEGAARLFHPNAQLVLKALKKVHAQGAYPGFELDLQGARLAERGYAYAAACYLLGEKAPKSWKEKANQLLFADERPYFKT